MAQQLNPKFCTFLHSVHFFKQYFRNILCRDTLGADEFVKFQVSIFIFNFKNNEAFIDYRLIRQR